MLTKSNSKSWIATRSWKSKKSFLVNKREVIFLIIHFEKKKKISK